MKDKAERCILYVPVFNRRAIASESLTNLRTVKGAAHLCIEDDASTEFDGTLFADLGDSYIRHPSNLGIDATRMAQLEAFLASPFDHCYFTDSDTVHDPEFLSRLFQMLERTGCVSCLYNTSTGYHKDQFNIDVGDDIVLRCSIPGVSMFFDKPLAARIWQYYQDGLRFRPDFLKEQRSWDWMYCDVFPQVAFSRVSFVEHLYAGGLHAHGRDAAVNPTPYLIAEGARLRRKLRLYGPGAPIAESARPGRVSP